MFIVHGLDTDPFLSGRIQDSDQNQTDPKHSFTENVTKIPFLESLKIMMNNEFYFNSQKRKIS